MGGWEGGRGGGWGCGVHADEVGSARYGGQHSRGGGMEVRGGREPSMPAPPCVSCTAAALPFTPIRHQWPPGVYLQCPPEPPPLRSPAPPPFPSPPHLVGPLDAEAEAAAAAQRGAAQRGGQYHQRPPARRLALGQVEAHLQGGGIGAGRACGSGFTDCRNSFRPL